MSNSLRTVIKDGLWAIVFAGFLASILRFASGLGAATGLNDATPWGLWIAFKLCFVALAGGGFTLAALVYIFHLERYRPILRRAILMALLGYGSFIVSLIFDLGLPWHIYMPVISWQHHSVMFEIAWCVMLYFSVLALEFAPAILEHPWFRHPVFQTVLDWLHRLTLPVVIAGIVLSTLHQSSLGSLFLIMRHRVHPLWYSPWLPYLFFTSAIAAGLMALVVEGFVMERWFKMPIRLDLLTSLAKWVPLPLLLYLVLRLGDLLLRGVLPGALDGSWQSVLFLVEILLGGLLPTGLLAVRKIRESREGLFTSAILVILGIASQRMSLSMFTMRQIAGSPYSPSPAEFLIAISIPAAAVLIYLFFAENLAVLNETMPARRVEEPTWDEQSALQGGPATARGIFARRSGLATFVVALMLPVMIQTPAGKNQLAIPVEPARGGDVLVIDGNRNGVGVPFPHLDHEQRLTTEAGDPDCQVCHHLTMANDEATGCWECHTDFYQARSIFDHSTHQQALGGNTSCTQCHDQEHLPQTGAICQDCHDSMLPAAGETEFDPAAPGYKDAMHARCLECHEEQAAAQDRKDLALCSTCHKGYQNELDQMIGRLPGD